MSLVAHVATGCIKTNRATRVEGKRMMMAILTPVQVEQRLVALSKEIDNAHHDLVEAEVRYSKAKTAYELGVAKVRLSYRGCAAKN